MKKNLVFILSLALILNAVLSACFAATAETATSDLNDHLVVHYDFEGSTVEEALTDKATAGTVSDNLVAYTPDNKNTDATGATVPATAVDSDAFRSAFAIDPERGTARVLQQGATLQAKSSADIRKLYQRDADNKTGTATWFVRFKLDDVDLGETRLVDMRVNTKSGCMFSILVDVNGMLQTNAARTKDKRSTYTYSTDTAGKVTEGQYINFVLVMETGTGTSGYNPDMKYTPYISYGIPTSAEDWTALTGTGFVSFRTDRLSDAPLSLFDRYDGAGANNSSLTYDDVRLYDKGLTTGEMTELFISGSFDTVRLIGAQTRKTDSINAFDVRFVAVSDVLDVSRVGFEVVAKCRKGENETVTKRVSVDTQTVYTSIRAGEETLRAADLGGEYIIALKIGNIPLTYDSVTFEIRPYLLCGETRIYGAEKVYTYTVTP